MVVVDPMVEVIFELDRCPKSNHISMQLPDFNTITPYWTMWLVLRCYPWLLIMDQRLFHPGVYLTMLMCKGCFINRVHFFPSTCQTYQRGFCPPLDPSCRFDLLPLVDFLQPNLGQGQGFQLQFILSYASAIKAIL